MKSRALVQHAAVCGSVMALLVACGGGLGTAGGGAGSILGNAACPELQGGAANATFDSDASANATISAFVTASGDLASVAAKAEAATLTACQNIAQDLGATPADLAPRDKESRVAATCRAAMARIDAILAQGASARLETRVTPPVCQVRADVAAQCKGTCSGSVDPGNVKANCQPGQLSGRCEAQCTGQCTGQCNGECQGTCEGQGGAAANAGGAQASGAGKCAGRCNGTCKGSCGGECKGGCSVDFKEPKCNVAMAGPKADARCEGSCKARGELEATCTPARAEVKASVDTGDMAKLAATLRANLAALVEVQIAYGERLVDDIQVLVRAGSELPSAFGNISARAGACIAAAANACVSAQASLRVSVQASASISGKASGSAGGGAGGRTGG